MCCREHVSVVETIEKLLFYKMTYFKLIGCIFESFDSFCICYPKYMLETLILYMLQWTVFCPGNS